MPIEQLPRMSNSAAPDRLVDMNSITRTQRAAIALTGAALFMVVLDNLIVASTLPAIQRDLGGELSTLGWVLDAYLLVFSLLMLTAAALGDRYGRRRLFTAGVVIFTAASAAGALAPNVEVLIAARAIQGVGGAVIMPLTLTLLGAAFPEDKRAGALAVWSSISMLGVALGPVVGGLLTDALSWHWIFWVNVPIGLVVALTAPGLLEESRGGAGRLDLTGLALVSGGLLPIVWATIRANEVGWGSAQTIAAYAVGAIVLTGFVAHQRRIPHAMVPPRLFAGREFRSINVSGFLLHFAMFAAFVMLIQFLTEVRHEGPVQSGVHTLFWTLMPMVVAPFAARLSRRVAPGLMVAVGLAVAAFGMGSLALVLDAGTDPLTLAPGLVVVGLGVGLVVPNLAAAALAGAAPGDIGKASGVLSTARQVGAVFGVAVGVAIFQAAGSDGAASTIAAGAQAGLVAATLAAVLGALAATAGLPRAAWRPALARAAD
jgi:EmrB/QacA subfamily drug resistance transporter